MNHPDGSQHEVAPEFRAHLEWQIESALRRETRFAAPVAGSLNGLRAAVVVLALLAIGSTAVVVSGEVQDVRQRNVLLDSARSEAELLRVRLDLVRADYQEAQRRFEVGTAGRESLLAAEKELRALEARLKRVQLDIAEIEATSAAPRDELQAPLVGNRDFVDARLLIELETAQWSLSAAEQALREVTKRFDVGMATRAAQLQAEADLAEARAAIQRAVAMRKLRLESLQGVVKVEDVAVAARRLELTLRRDWLQRELELARARVAEVRRQVDVGMATQLELKRVEVEVLERELELKRIQREIEALPAVRR